MKASAGSTATRAAESLAYLDDYLDTVESLPLELQRQFTLMQDLDAKAQSIMASVGAKAGEFIDNVTELSPQERIKMLQSLNEMLVESLRQGEEKVALATAAYDVVDRHVRRLDDDLQKYEDEQMIGPGRLGNNTTSAASGSTAADRKEDSSNAAASSNTISNKKGASSSTDAPSTKRKKHAHSTNNSSSNAATPSSSATDKRKKDAVATTGASKAPKKTSSFAELPIDPNEPLYCYCQQVSYGEMVACDNGDCEIEWFHLSCAGLKAPPKGKWYCKDCSQKSKKPQKK